MPVSQYLLALLAVFLSQSANAGGLEALNQAGRQIAESPCPKPKISTKVQKSIHDEAVTDRYITQRCSKAGSEVVRSSVSEFRRAFPLFASVSRPDSRVPSAFQVGTQIASIKASLGAPEVVKADSITYLLPSETLEERVTFLHDGSRVVGIQWSWYFD